MPRRRFGREPLDSGKKEALGEAFKAMRHRGLVARQAFSCCGSCAGYELAQYASAQAEKGKADRIKGCVFYNKQTAENMRNTGKGFLAFGCMETTAHGTVGLPTVEVGKIVCEELERAGLTFEWDGTEHKCILIDLRQPWAVERDKEQEARFEKYRLEELARKATEAMATPAPV